MTVASPLRRCAALAGMSALLAATPCAAQGPWYVAAPPSPEAREAILDDADARAVAGELRWRARWRVYVDAGLTHARGSEVRVAPYRHQMVMDLGSAFGIGVRRALLPWMDLDLRLGAAVPGELWPQPDYGQLCSENIDTGDVPQPRRTAALLGLDAALRVRPFGVRVPFFVVAGARASLLIVGAAEDLRYRCAPTGGLPSGPTLQAARPVSAAFGVGVLGGLGAAFGQHDMFDFRLLVTHTPGFAAQDVTLLFSVSLF
jgi:hypothetical protein